eukprot:678798-Amphidinium_carterae.2
MGLRRGDASIPTEKTIRGEAALSEFKMLAGTMIWYDDPTMYHLHWRELVAASVAALVSDMFTLSRAFNCCFLEC